MEKVKTDLAKRKRNAQSSNLFRPEKKSSKELYFLNNLIMKAGPLS